MKIGKQARLGAKELFRACQVNGALDENRVREVVRRVLDGKPRGYLAMLSHFLRLVKLDLDRRSARVESAIPLPEDLKAQVRANLARVYGADLSLAFEHNPALIGGMKIKVGSDVYDGSVRERLRALEKSF